MEYRIKKHYKLLLGTSYKYYTAQVYKRCWLGVFCWVSLGTFTKYEKAQECIEDHKNPFIKL